MDPDTSAAIGAVTGVIALVISLLALEPHRFLGEANELWVDLSWKDGRLRRQTDSVLVMQERTPRPSGPSIPDKQIDKIAARLGEGVGKAVNQAVRRR